MTFIKVPVRFLLILLVFEMLVRLNPSLGPRRCMVLPQCPIRKLKTQRQRRLEFYPFFVFCIKHFFLKNYCPSNFILKVYHFKMEKIHISRYSGTFCISQHVCSGVSSIFYKSNGVFQQYVNINYGGRKKFSEYLFQV